MKEIEESAKDLKEPKKINMFSQLIKGKVDCSGILQQSIENLEKRSDSSTEDVYDLTQAIIMTTMAQKAEKFDSSDLDRLG